MDTQFQVPPTMLQSVRSLRELDTKLQTRHRSMEHLCESDRKGLKASAGEDKSQHSAATDEYSEFEEHESEPEPSANRKSKLKTINKAIMEKFEQQIRDKALP